MASFRYPVAQSTLIFKSWRINHKSITLNLNLNFIQTHLRSTGWPVGHTHIYDMLVASLHGWGFSIFEIEGESARWCECGCVCWWLWCWWFIWWWGCCYSCSFFLIPFVIPQFISFLLKRYHMHSLPTPSVPVMPMTWKAWRDCETNVWKNISSPRKQQQDSLSWSSSRV